MANKKKLLALAGALALAWPIAKALGQTSSVDHLSHSIGPPSGTQVINYNRAYDTGTITTTGGSILGTPFPLANSHSARIKCDGIGRIVTAGTGDSIGDSYAGGYWYTVTMSSGGVPTTVSTLITDHGSTGGISSSSAGVYATAGSGLISCGIGVQVTSGTLGTMDVSLVSEIFYD